MVDKPRIGVLSTIIGETMIHIHSFSFSNNVMEIYSQLSSYLITNILYIFLFSFVCKIISNYFLKRNQKQLLLTTKTIKMPKSQDQILDFKNAHPQAVSIKLNKFLFDFYTMHYVQV